LATARERFGRTHNLPESLIPRLEGETDEEIEADALRLKEDLGIKVSTKRQGPPKSPPAGGLNPADEQVADEEIVQRLLKGQRNFYLANFIPLMEEISVIYRTYGRTRPHHLDRSVGPRAR